MPTKKSAASPAPTALPGGKPPSLVADASGVEENWDAIASELLAKFPTAEAALENPTTDPMELVAQICAYTDTTEALVWAEVGSTLRRQVPVVA